MRAADLVLPAPNALALGYPVRPSRSERTNPPIAGICLRQRQRARQQGGVAPSLPETQNGFNSAGRLPSVNSEENFPLLHGRARVDWLSLDAQRITIYKTVFSRMCSPKEGLLLPGLLAPDTWFDFVLTQRHLWPTACYSLCLRGGGFPQREAKIEIQAPLEWISH